MMPNWNKIIISVVCCICVMYAIVIYSVERGLLRPGCPECEHYDLRADASGMNYPCVQMKIKPSTTICLHREAADIFVSKSFYHNGIWEAKIVKELQRFLTEHPDSGLIDLGANIGTYTLVIATMGHNVLSVEPNIENVHRIHKAVSLAGLSDRVTLIFNAVSNERGISKKGSGGARPNIGAIQYLPASNESKGDYSGSDYTKSITMNDLLPFCKFKMAVMKIDIEGSEHRAFGAAGELFDNINIPYVQMEWVRVKELGSENANVEDRELFHHMIDFLVERHYTPRKTLHGERLNLTKWESWPWDLVWVKQEYMD